MNSNHTPKLTFRSASALVLAIAMLASTGCMGGLGLTNSALPTEPVSGDSAGVYQVQMTGNFSKSTVYQGELDGPITVQDALERSGATEKFRSMDIMIYRVVEETGYPLKLKVDYTSRNKSVKPELNYALHPNDRILVQSRTTNAIDKVIDSLNPNN